MEITFITFILWNKEENITAVISKNGCFDNIDSAAIVSRVSKAEQKVMMAAASICCRRNFQFYELLRFLFFSSSYSILIPY